MRLLARVNALQNFVETEDGADLLTAYKRAANILKKENWTGRSHEFACGAGNPADWRRGPLVLVDEPIVGRRWPKWRRARRAPSCRRRRR